MADSSKEELVQLIKRFGAYLTVKISNLLPISLQRLDSRSVRAVAVLAVAIVFTWRLLRSPSVPPRRQPKRQAGTPSTSSVSTHSNSTLVPSGGSSSLEDSRAQNVVDEFFQPVKPTLGQIVRQKLSEGRKVTCRLVGVILEESSPEDLQKQATVRSAVLEVLLEITKYCDLYLMERVLDDENEKKVLMALEDAGVFTSGGLVKDKSCFYVPPYWRSRVAVARTPPSARTKGALEQQSARRHSGALSTSKLTSNYPSPKLHASLSSGSAHMYGYKLGQRKKALSKSKKE